MSQLQSASENATLPMHKPAHSASAATQRIARKWLPTVLALGLACFIAVADAATVRFVSNTNDSGAGSLRASIAASAAGDTVAFSTPNPSTIVLTSGELALTLGITIQGPGAANLTISGNNAFRIFNSTATTAPATVTLSGMTLRNGAPQGGTLGGGAILINSGATAPQFNIVDMVITNNNVSAAGNPLGGGIGNEGGTVLISGSSIVNNTASFRGGGIQNQGSGSMTIINSTIAGNTAGATGIGGGIRSLVPLTVISSTIVGNSAQTGGNIARFSNNTITLLNTIVAGGILLGTGGASPDIAGAVVSNDYNLIQDTTGATITGTTTHNIIGAPADLGPLGGMPPVMIPLAGSLAIDNGIQTGSGGFDQLANPRAVTLNANFTPPGDRSDIGAIERQTVARPCTMDIDGDNKVDPLTDGLIMIRALFGLTGTSVTNGALGANAKRTTWAQIQPYLNANCGTTFLP